MDDDEISALVARLARPHASGGVVIERAAILAAGTDFQAVMDWVVAYGHPEAVVAPPARGLHGSRLHDSSATESRKPLRFVLPRDAGSASRPAGNGAIFVSQVPATTARARPL